MVGFYQLCWFVVLHALRLVSSHSRWTDCSLANCNTYSLEPLCLFSAWNVCECVVYSVDYSWQFMRFNPLALAEANGDSFSVSTRIETACEQSNFVFTFWSWQPLSVALQSFLSTRERAILSRTNSVFCFDSPSVALVLTEIREELSVDSWEVPSPGVAAWSRPEELPN